MKRLSPILFIIFLVINVIAGLILSCYPLFNVVLNSVVICVAALLSQCVNKKSLAPAFSTSLAFVISTITFIEFLIGLFAPSQFQDNWGIIAILCLFAFEGFLIYAVIKRSEKTIKQ